MNRVAHLAAALAGRLARWIRARLPMAVPTRNAFFRVRHLPSPLVGRPAPAFRLSEPGGATADLARWRGKPVVLVFWSSF